MKYAIVGTGARHAMFRTAVAETYGQDSALVGLCDTNPHRLALSARSVPDQPGNGIATYRADGFGAMLAEQTPDTVIVTTPDDLHHEYIVAALEAGCDVITEKPMTTDLKKLRAILDAQARTGRKVTVSFNYRYTPARTQIKGLLMDGAIGDVTAVDFRWHLDRVHGADYFRRWHRYKDRSGGLLVHKSTHHFDLLNWWLGSRPARVSAAGKRAFYTPEMADRLGLSDRGERCHRCPAAPRCDFEMDLSADAPLKALYMDGEEHDGYYRDRCVFAPDITIEDTMQLAIQYESGASANYTLLAYSPWEGLEVKFHGTEGELTHRHVETHGVFGGRRDKSARDSMTIDLHPAGRRAERIDVWEGEGDHGGADPIMLGYIFAPQTMEQDRYDRSSDHLSGAWSILTGIAGNISMAEDRMVSVADMLAENGIALKG